MQQTLILLKPERGSAPAGRGGNHRAVRAKGGCGWRRLKLLKAPREMAEKHYAVHKGKPFYESLLTFLTSGPTVAMVWEGREAGGGVPHP